MSHCRGSAEPTSQAPSGCRTVPGRGVCRGVRFPCRGARDECACLHSWSAHLESGHVRRGSAWAVAAPGCRPDSAHGPSARDGRTASPAPTESMSNDSRKPTPLRIRNHTCPGHETPGRGILPRPRRPIPQGFGVVGWHPICAQARSTSTRSRRCAQPPCQGRGRRRPDTVRTRRSTLASPIENR